MAISTARQFFDGLVAGGVPAIEALVTDAVHETEWLDFKSGEHLKDAAETWSEAIASFANNQGGVLIWGLDARKDKATGIDAASDVKPVPNPAVLRSRLLELLRGAAEPPVIGIEVRDFSRADGTGFVVCLIPESDAKPHRAELLTNKPYKIRIADSFQHLSPSLLRNLFFPRSSARLWIEIEPQWEFPEIGRTVANNQMVNHRVTIHNSGLASARDIFVIIATDPKGLDIATPYKRNAVPLDDEIGIEHVGIIHPMSRSQLCTIKQPTTTRVQADSNRIVPACSSITAQFQLFATDMPPAKISIKIGDRDIVERTVKKGFPVS